MKYISTKATIIESGAFQNQKVFPVLLLEIKTTGSFNPLTLLQITLKLSGKQKPDGSIANIYYTAAKDSFSTDIPYATITLTSSSFIVKGEQELKSGSNYLWVAIVPEAGSERVLPDLQFVSVATGLQEYKQVWADEFSKDGPPDAANWSFEKGFVRNSELQWYQEENAFCKKGVLTIEARQDSVPNPRYEAGNKDWRRNRPFIHYTSSSIKTSGKQTWTYGRFEMRARLDTNIGCWPAWWCLGTEGGGWPNNGEIDMMEFYRGKILANYAVGTEKQYTAKWYSTATPVADFKKQNWTDSFHTWRMDWDSLKIAIYLDDVLLNEQPQSNLYNRNGDRNYFPFRHPQYMVLNLAIGGQNGGDPSLTSFPRKYEIDYVRVAQKENGKYNYITLAGL